MPMSLPQGKVLTALLLVALATPLGASGQSVAEIARESKRKREKEGTARKVWTNDDLRAGLPSIKLLGKTGDLPSLGSYEPTPLPLVEAMLRLAGVQPENLVFDLGSGDGRIVIMAAEKFRARAVGIEIDQALVAESRKAIEAKGLEDRVKIIHANVFDVDLRPAQVVTLYVAPGSMESLRKHLKDHLRPGTRVVSHAFEIPAWSPTRVIRVEGTPLYLYVVAGSAEPALPPRDR